MKIPIAALLVVLSATLHGQTVLDFRSVDTAQPPYTVDAEPYLKKFGITVSGLTHGTHLLIANNRSVYEEQAARPTHPPNLLLQNGSNDPISFTLTFSSPVCSISIIRPELIAATPSGVTHPIWSAHAFDGPGGRGKELAVTGEPLIASYFNVMPRTLTLTGPNIRSLRIDSLNLHFAAFSSVLIGELSFDLPPCAAP